MAGFDFLEDMAPEEEPSAAPTPAAPLVYGQMPAGAKASKFAVPTPKTGVPISPSILEDMERIYQERVAAKDPFSEYIKDALAWGGTDRPNSTLEALSKRRESKEAEAAELFRMRSDMAAIRAQQEQAARSSEFLGSRLGAGEGAPGVISGRGEGQLPPQLADYINYLRRNGQVAKAEELYKDYMKTVGTETVKRLQHPDYNVPNIEVSYFDPEKGTSRLRMASRREIDENPDMYSMTGRVAPAPAAPAGRPAPAAASPAQPSVKAPVNYTYDELSPEDIAKLENRMIQMGIDPRDSLRREGADVTFNKRSLEQRKQVFDILGLIPSTQAAPSTPSASSAPTAQAAPATPAPRAPVAPSAVAPAQAARAPADRKSVQELKNQQEVEKQLDISAAQEKFKTDAKKREVFDTNTDPMVVSERLTRARRAQDLVKNNPEIAGVVSGRGYANAVGTVLQQGISTPVGSISVAGLSDAIYKTLPSTIDTQKRYELAGILANMELDASAVMNGQGQISDGERKILQKAAISIEDPAEVVYKKAKMMEARQETLQKLREVYGDGSKYIRNFDAFKNDPQYKRITKEYEDKLQAIADEKVKFEKKMPKESAQPKSRAFTDPEKERRYQEWRRSQRGQ